MAKLWKLRRGNLSFRLYPVELIEENKWRAVRYGLDGKLIDFGKQQELPARDLMRELIEWFIGDVVDELGSRREVEYAYRILQEGSSAERQLATYQRTGDLKAVVDQLIQETSEGKNDDQEIDRYLYFSRKRRRFGFTTDQTYHQVYRPSGICARAAPVLPGSSQGRVAGRSSLGYRTGHIDNA